MEPRTHNKKRSTLKVEDKKTRINSNEINTEIGDIYKKNINNPDAPYIGG